jgi:ActR/RegA family two-component response regulator
MDEILLIDNEDDLLTFLKSALTARGYGVRCLNRADQAFEILANEEVDLVVVDECLEGGPNGSEFLKKLRDQGNDIPAILMTGLGTRALMGPMKQLGAVVVPKPAAGSDELLKDLVPAIAETLKGEAELVELINRTVKLALKVGKTASNLHYLLDWELCGQISNDPTKIPERFPGTEGGHPQENSIRLRGEIWHLRYQGESGDFPKIQALRYLQKLLAAPNKLFTVADLYIDPEGKVEAASRMIDDRQVDDEGIKLIRKELDDVEEMGNTTGWTEALETKRMALKRHLEDADKQMASTLKTTHHAIATSIRNFLRDRLPKANMPHLRAHLRPALKLDLPYFGYYPPPGASAWQI